MRELLNQIEEQINEFKENAREYIIGNKKIAGKRARKNSTNLTKLFKEFRQDSVNRDKTGVN